MVNEVEAENANAEPAKEFVFTIENVISDVTLSQDGCDERENGLVMIDSGASVNVCPKWCGKSKMEQSENTTFLRGANGKPLQEYGERQIWLKICGQTKRYDFHVVNVTKLILSVSCLCEHGVETHLAKKSFLRFGDGHEPLIRKGGVYYGKAHTVNAVESETHDKPQNRCRDRGDAQKWCRVPEDAKNDAEILEIHKIGAEIQEIHKVGAYLQVLMSACGRTMELRPLPAKRVLMSMCGRMMELRPLPTRRVPVSTCGRTMKLKSLPKIKEIAGVMMLT